MSRARKGLPSPRRPRLASTEPAYAWRALSLLVLACVVAVSRTAAAAPASVVVEIDAAAERVVDARSARRLVPLELSDVTVPASSRQRGAPVLFFRVLGHADGSLRIELWERGEYHGARRLAGAGENPQLVARRVALAAAELGRRLARKRAAVLARQARLHKIRVAQAKLEQERTQDGPLAVRTELAVGAGPRKMLLFGQSVSGEVSVGGSWRLDVGGELWAGVLRPALGLELQGVSVGPAYRLVLARGLDLDVGLKAAGLLIQVPAARSLDGLLDQDSSWTARLSALARVELRLSRQVRALLGVEAGSLLRAVPLESEHGSERLRGFWCSAALGVVLTPPR